MYSVNLEGLLLVDVLENFSAIRSQAYVFDS